MSAPDRLGDFRVVEEIGRGGFGIVYRAHQISLQRPVALKVLYEHKVHTRESIARFEREAQAAGRLDHPAIVSVYAWGQEDGRFFIAQRLVGKGRTLADRLEELREAGEQPKGYFREIAEGLARIADGLQHAHDRGIVHRDVKPSNILLDERDQPHLGDFGLAKIEDGLALSRTGDMTGSPYYMSPEQADSRRGPIDHRCDIYSLGATLYELLALRPPFPAESAHEIVRRIINEEPRPPRALVERVPRDLETICLKALEKARSRRYQTAAAFAADLRAFLEGEPISAVPAGRLSRLWRKTRRHRTTMALVGAASVIIVGLLWAFQEQRREDAIERQRESQIRDVVDDGRRAVDETTSRRINQALAEGDTEQARTLMEQRDEFLDVVEKARDLFVDTVTTGDKKLAEILSTTIEEEQEQGRGFSLVSGLEAMVKAYEEQRAATGDRPVDPAVQEASSLLERVRDNPIMSTLLGAGAAGLEEAELPVRTRGVAPGREPPRPAAGTATSDGPAPAPPTGEAAAAPPAADDDAAPADDEPAPTDAAGGEEPAAPPASHASGADG